MSDNFDPDALDREYARRQAERMKTETRNEAPKPRSEAPKNKPKKERRPIAPVRFFKDRRTKMFAGIALVLWSAYLLVSAVSYFAIGSDDQSIVVSNTVSKMAENPEDVQNFGGAFGAYLSQNFISNGLGIGAFALIYYFFAVGMSLLNRNKKQSFWFLTMRCLILAITLSVVTGLITFKADSWFFWGGIHGYEINRFLISHTGVFGAMLVSILLIGLVMSIYLNELRKVYVAYRRRVNKHRAKVAAERAAKEEERRRIEQTLRESAEMVDGKNDEDNQEQDNVRETPPARIFVDDSLDALMDGEEPERRSPDDYRRHDSVITPEAQPEVKHDDRTGYGLMEATTMPQSTESVATVAETVKEEIAEPAETEQEAVGLTVNVNTVEKAESIETNVYDPTAELPRFHFPPIELLSEMKNDNVSVDEQEMEENKQRITATLANYGISINSIEATVGPTVTLYKIIPTEGTRISKIKGLEDDIALNLAALGIRIIAPIPGEGAIGIEVPNKDPQMVPMRSIITSKKFQECRHELPMAMGLTISKDVLIADLAKMPHVLVAGATGQGKSVGLNAIITSLLYKKHPSELKFVLVDPKKVEFSLYARLERHYLAKLPEEEEPIITDTSKVVATLNSLCVEMDNRYALLKEANVRNIKEYNAKFIQRRLNPEKGHRFLPYIVIIIDEFGDLMITAGKEVETPITRIAQLARAVGMHMILATQRPSTNVITGIIKANFPGRIAFRVSQMVDSRTILDRPGANQLIGKGDMLFSHNGEMDRVQCAFISTEEAEAICDSIDEQVGYPSAYYLPDYIPENDGGGAIGSINDLDPLFKEAAQFVVSSNTASTSSLQRRYSIGYNRAGKIMDQLEAKGIVGPASGAKPRNVLVDTLMLERMLENEQ